MSGITSISLGDHGLYWFVDGGTIIHKDGRTYRKDSDTGEEMDLSGVMIVTQELPEGHKPPERKTKTFVIEIPMPIAGC